MILLGILASSVRTVLPDELLSPTNLAASLIGGLVKLTWTDRNTNETGHRIYRSSSPMDTQALPPPVAELGPDVTEWEDTDTPVDQATHYIVSAVRGAEEAFSDEVVIDTASAVDPHWDKVVALLHFDGNLNDATGREWEVTGSPTFTPTPAKFGQSIYLPNRDTRLQTVANPLVSLESFTIETFFCIPSGHGNPVVYHAIAGQTGSGGGKGQTFWARGNDGCIQFSRGVSVGSAVSLEGVTPVLNDVVYHAALTYDYPAEKLRLFLDGNLEAEANNAVGWIPEDRFTIGAYINNTYTTYGLYGYLDEFRITKGVARYTENFDPPTEPFPNQ